MGHIIPAGTGFDYHKKAKKMKDSEFEDGIIFDFTS